MTLRIQTFLMGEIDVEERDLIFFPRGLPGFEKFHRWVLAGEEENSVKWLISADCGQITLPVACPSVIDREYSPRIPEDILEDLGIEDLENALILAVLNLPRERPWEGTANFLAPLVLNPDNKRARQVVISDERYSVYTPLLSKADTDCLQTEEKQAGTEEGGH